MRAKATRKVGPLPLWAWGIIAAGVGLFLYRRFHSQQVATGDQPPPGGFQPIMPGAVTPVPAMSSSVVSTPVANGVGSQSIAGSSTFTVPKLGFSSAGTGTGGGGGGGGLEQAGNVAGYSADQVAAAAARYAQGKSYGGYAYSPHMVVQEQHIETRGGVPGVYVKYDTGPLGASTEWTPLQ